MTATRRLSILRQTLESFYSKLFYQNDSYHYDLIVNIDPAGDDVPSMDIVNHCICTASHIPVTFNCPTTPSFPEAFRWVWKTALSTEADLVFNLEDDWILNRFLFMSDIYAIFDKYPELAILRLSSFPSGLITTKIWNKWTDAYNGSFFPIKDCDRGLLGFAGHPSFIRRSFVELAVECLDPKRNPEKQLKGRNKHLKDYFNTHMFGVYNQPLNMPLIRDIGRKWMINNGFRKVGSKAHFVNWENMNSSSSSGSNSGSGR